MPTRIEASVDFPTAITTPEQTEKMVNTHSTVQLRFDLSFLSDPVAFQSNSQWPFALESSYQEIRLKLLYTYFTFPWLPQSR